MEMVKAKGTDNPLVSVIIPVYNVMPYIIQCLDSVQKQTYEKLEIILINDGSNDGSEKFCNEIKKLDPRIVVIHKENGGVVSARNAGIRFAHGKYIVFVDGDDWIESDMIEEMVRRIGDADLLSIGVYQEQAPECIIERIDRFSQGNYTGAQELTYLYERMIYDQETGCLQPMTPWIYNKLYVASMVKDVHEKVSQDLVFAEDSVFLYLYMLECKSIVICDKCFYHYRYREGSAIHRINEHMLMDINRVYLVLLDIFRAHPMGKKLLYQLQQWVTIRTCIAINETMGFDSRIHIPEFVLDMGALGNKNLVLYGAGKVGQDAYRQIKEFGYPVVLWVDRAYKQYQEKGLPISAPSDILNCSYDAVMIAMEDETVAEKVRKTLEASGIHKDKIIWRKPMKLY